LKINDQKSSLFSSLQSLNSIFKGVDMPSKKRILVVDDDSAILTTLRGAFELKGYEVLTAKDGSEALDKILSEEIDLIVLDILMPVLDGFEVCRRSRENVLIKNIPIILLTLATDVNEIVTGLQLGADDYLIKPFKPDELITRAEVIFHRSQRLLNIDFRGGLLSNTMIKRRIQEKLERGEQFVLAYLDLGNFDSFKNIYGYEYANSVIENITRIVAKVVENNASYGGYLGEDNFIIILPPSKIRAMCREIIEEFDDSIPMFYEPKERERGYIVIEDSEGNPTRFPLMSISIAVITALTEEERISPKQLSILTARLKDYVKSLPGSNYVIDRELKEYFKPPGGMS